MKDFSTILLVLLALLIFSVNTHVIPIDISSRGLSSNETSAFPGPLHPRPNYAGRPALKQFSDMTKTAQVLQGHKDAVLLATSAYDNFDATSDAFKRYFEPGDADLVKGIYGLIGGITQAYKGSNNNYGNVQVFYGDDVSVDAFTGGQNGWRNCRNMPYMLGQTIQGLPGRLNLVEVMTCPNMYLLPKLTDVKCSEFGAKPAEDSGWMAAVGSTLLHEYAHNVLLLVTAPDYGKLIGQDCNDPKGHITDYVASDAWPSPPGPKSGYGPMQSNEIVKHYNGDARHNADNYQWFALDVYWDKVIKCDNAPFTTSTNPKAAFIRYGPNPPAINFSPPANPNPLPPVDPPQTPLLC